VSSIERTSPQQRTRLHIRAHIARSRAPPSTTTDDSESALIEGSDEATSDRDQRVPRTVTAAAGRTIVPYPDGGSPAAARTGPIGITLEARLWDGHEGAAGPTRTHRYGTCERAVPVKGSLAIGEAYSRP